MKCHSAKHSPSPSGRVLAGAGLLAAIAVAGCSATSGAAGSGPPASSPAGAASSTAPGGQSSAPGPSVSASPRDLDEVQNLVVSSAVRGQLTSTYLSMRQIPASDVSGTQPNGLYYAYDPASNTY